MAEKASFYLWQLPTRQRSSSHLAPSRGPAYRCTDTAAAGSISLYPMAVHLGNFQNAALQADLCRWAGKRKMQPLSATKADSGQPHPGSCQYLSPGQVKLSKTQFSKNFVFFPPLKLLQMPSCTTSSYLRFTSPFLSSLLWAEHAPGSRPPPVPGPAPWSRAGLWQWALLGGKHISKLKPQHNCSLSFLCKLINLIIVY